MNFSANLCTFASFAFKTSVIDPCFIRRVVVLLCLFTLGCGGEAPQLIAELQHDDPQVRVKAARALADPRFADNERVIAALIMAMDDAVPSVGEAAITSLGAFGGKAKPALPQLETALANSDPDFRLSAARAIAKIDPASSAYQAVFLESLRAGNGPLFLEVGQMGNNAEWAVPTLVDLLSNRQTFVRALSARTLGEIGIASDDVTAALQRRLQDKEPSVRRAAEAALEALQSASVIPAQAGTE